VYDLQQTDFYAVCSMYCTTTTQSTSRFDLLVQIFSSLISVQFVVRRQYDHSVLSAMHDDGC